MVDGAVVSSSYFKEERYLEAVPVLFSVDEAESTKSSYLEVRYLEAVNDDGVVVDVVESNTSSYLDERYLEVVVDGFVLVLSAVGFVFVGVRYLADEEVK